MQNRNNIITTTIVLALGFFALSPGTLAVTPAPDGGYPGGNTAEGQNALLSLTGGTNNTAVGFVSLRSNTTGSYNTGIGAGALFANTGDENTATGFVALFSNTGTENTANGALALFNNIGGASNTASGYNALFSNTTGDANTANGASALSSNTSGMANTAIGELALAMNTTGSRNIALGENAGVNVTTANNVICIGAAGNNVDNSCYIGNIFGVTSSGGGSVFVNMNGRLGTSTSSKRFKEDIKPIAHASQTLFSLTPVTFRYKKGIDPEGPQGKSEFGLVAEEVEKVNPDLIVRDKEGKPYSVRYDQVNAMLLNEFLKEHKAFVQEREKVEKLETIIAERQKGIEVLSAHLKEQDAKIQKVSDRIEINKVAAGRIRRGGPASEVASNDPQTVESNTISQ